MLIKLFKGFLNSCKELLGSNEDSLRKVPRLSQTAEELLPDAVSSFKCWHERASACYYRDNSTIYTRFLFPDNADLESAFGNVISKFFVSHGNWRVIKSVPEIHVCFVSVDAYVFKEPWNQRDRNCKKPLINDLRQAYVDYAKQKGYRFDGLFDWLISGLWFVDDKLILEMPVSEFPIRYPKYISSLMPRYYHDYVLNLSGHTQI